MAEDLRRIPESCGVAAPGCRTGSLGEHQHGEVERQQCRWRPAGDKQAWARWEAERALESGFHSVLGDRQRVLSWEVRGSRAHVNETVWLRVACGR